MQHLCFIVNFCGISKVLGYFSASLYYLSFSLLTTYHTDFQLCFVLTIAGAINHDSLASVLTYVDGQGL